MTTLAVLCDPPRDGLVLTDLPDTSPLSISEVTDLYTAMLRDVCVAVEASGGDLLVNYRPDDSRSASTPETEEDVHAEVRAVVREVLDDPDAARFERQVGETFAGRAGNTATHLLEQEGIGSVAIVQPNAPLLSRQHIDTAAMKLRRYPVVLGPSTGGRVYYAGFEATIDYVDAYATPAVETLTDKALAVGHEVDFLAMQPVVERGDDLTTLLSLIRARQRAGRTVPEHTTAFFDESGLEVVEEEDGQTVTRYR
jgi:2-phospho-L-lactate guanylyltransferase (CobY/MobA/RfbA family)